MRVFANAHVGEIDKRYLSSFAVELSQHHIPPENVSYFHVEQMRRVKGFAGHR